MHRSLNQCNKRFSLNHFNSKPLNLLDKNQQYICKTAVFTLHATPLLLLTWGQGLFELLSLLLVCDDQGVQVPAAAHLELNIVLVLLDLYGLGILPPGCQQEIFDFFYLARHAAVSADWTSDRKSVV